MQTRFDVGFDQVLFDGPPLYDEAALTERVGVSTGYARALWRAMGFPAVPEGAVAFFEDDLDALSTAANAGRGDHPPAGLLQQTRAISAAMARVAERGVDDLVGIIGALRAQGMPDATIAEVVLGFAEVGQTEKLLWYLFRRQFRAAAWRRLAQPGDQSRQATTTVGFVDLVRFAALTEEIAEDELERLIGRFEEVARDSIADVGGRVVKMIGDAVMFVADEPEVATRVALRLVETYSEDPLVPPARAGLASGPVLARDGDYFGPTVNLASRIVDVARVSRVVVSNETRYLLDGVPDLRFRRLPPKRLKGVGEPELWVVEGR